jgi:hypothetical protein
MRRIEIRVLSSSERGGLDTYPAHRVHAVLAAEPRPRSAPDWRTAASDADGVKYRVGRAEG